MSESYYTGSQRCEKCGELSADTKSREIEGQTLTLCGECALEEYCGDT